MHFVLPDGDCEDAEGREVVGRSLDHNVVVGEPGSWEDATHHTMTLADP